MTNAPPRLAHRPPPGRLHGSIVTCPAGGASSPAPAPPTVRAATSAAPPSAAASCPAATRSRRAHDQLLRGHAGAGGEEHPDRHRRPSASASLSPATPRRRWALSGPGGANRPLAVVSRDAANNGYVMSYTPVPSGPGADPEGDVSFVATLIDAAGNQGHVELPHVAVFDFTPPSARRRPRRQRPSWPCPSRRPPPARCATSPRSPSAPRLRVDFAASEPLPPWPDAGAPVVTLGSGATTVTLSPVSGNGLSYVYETLVAAGLPRGTSAPLTARLTDLAGNVTDVALATVPVITQPPATPAVGHGRRRALPPRALGQRGHRRGAGLLPARRRRCGARRRDRHRLLRPHGDLGHRGAGRPGDRPHHRRRDGRLRWRPRRPGPVPALHGRRPRRLRRRRRRRRQRQRRRRRSVQRGAGRPGARRGLDRDHARQDPGARLPQPARLRGAVGLDAPRWPSAGASRWRRPPTWGAWTAPWPRCEARPRGCRPVSYWSARQPRRRRHGLRPGARLPRRVQRRQLGRLRLRLLLQPVGVVPRQPWFPAHDQRSRGRRQPGAGHRVARALRRRAWRRRALRRDRPLGVGRRLVAQAGHVRPGGRRQPEPAARPRHRLRRGPPAAAALRRRGHRAAGPAWATPGRPTSTPGEGSAPPRPAPPWCPRRAPGTRWSTTRSAR